MEKIKSEYGSAEELIKYFGEERIKKRFAFFLDAIEQFILSLGDKYNNKLHVNDKVLQHCILDYFADIERLKEFHEIEKINDIKRISYESYWILRRKPIQILSQDNEDDGIVYANEKFILAYLMQELLKDDVDKVLSEENTRKFDAFAESLYYYLKYRDCSAKILELMMLAFKAGMAYKS